MPTQDPSPVLLLAGQGPRRWQVLAEDGAAIALPARAVRDRLTVRLQGNAEQARAVLTQAQRWHDAGLAVAGWLGYELGAALESVPLQPGLDDLPDADLIAFLPEDLQPAVLPQASHGRQLPEPADLLRQGPALIAAVAQALEAIRAGEIYQVNLSVAAHLPEVALLDVPLADLLAAVQSTQPVPLALAWQGQGYRLLSGSMERFLAVASDSVSSRPIKGTAPRHADPCDDAAEALALPDDAKEAAENTMIVDMVRNDLQRACEWGSVQVPVLLQAVPYATLWHLESEVRGILRQPHDGAGLLAATLPPASVVGCPKIQAMHVIARLEGRRRGPYCGTAGVWLPDGRADWAVGIRQVLLTASGAQLSVGAGIVADSQPEREWQEIRLKARGALRWLGAMQSSVLRKR